MVQGQAIKKQFALSNSKHEKCLLNDHIFPPLPIVTAVKYKGEQDEIKCHNQKSQH